MTQDEIIEMTRQAGGFSPTPEFLEAFAKLVAAKEREACAKIADQPSEATYECIVACGGPEQTFTQSFPKQAHEIAVAIRARGEA